MKARFTTRTATTGSENLIPGNARRVSLLQEIVLPRLGQTVEEASIDKWLVREGDVIKKGDILLEITTDKATLEVESYFEGTVLKILAPAGQQVPVDTIIAYVGDPATDRVPETPPPRAKAARPKEKRAPVRPAAAGPALAAGPVARPGRVTITPRARKLAEREKVTPLGIRGTGPGGRIVEADVAAYAEKVAQLRVSPTAREIAYTRGVDLLTVKGTGAGGRIMKSDVEKAAPIKTEPSAGRRLELTAMRRIVGERMAQSKREAPHFYLQMEIDMTEAVALRQELSAAGTEVSYNDLIIKAIARGFEAVPMMNAGWAGDGVVVFSAVDVALAVAIDDGLMVPVVRGVERLGLENIAAQTAALIEKARTRHLAPFEYEGGSITVSNLGMYGVQNFLPIINPGQGSILGVGNIAERPVVVDGGIAVRKIMGVTLAIDHRVADGAIAAAFLKAVKDALESPRENLI